MALVSSRLTVLATVLLAAAPSSAAVPTWPAVREVWHDDFEGEGLSEIWEDFGKGGVGPSSAAAHPPGSRGLAVDISGADQRYLQRYNLTDWPHLEFPRDTYFRFSLHPNGAIIPAGETVALVRMRDAGWNLMVGLRLRQEGSGYAVVLEKPDGTLDAEPLPLADGWNTVVVGVRPHGWIGAWVGDRARVVPGVAHAADFVTALLVGKADGNWSGSTPSGTIYLDDSALLFAAYADLWVDAQAGSDGNEGTSEGSPLRTLGAAAKLSSAGAVIHVAPGDYRESLVQPTDGAEGSPVRYVSTGGRRQARILGSNAASSLTWSRPAPGEIDVPSGVASHLWKADLSPWGLDHPPAFVVARAADGTITRLPWAREPDEKVETAWKYHEFWWAAEGGSQVTTCDPASSPDCDRPDRSDRYLIDGSDDVEPPGIEAGSLASLGDVTGAIIHVKDNWSGHYTFRRRVAETLAPGRIRLEKLPEGYTEGCWFDHDPSNPALGWNSKYFLEGLPKFLDAPGEWIFDQATRTIYVWTPDGRSPAETGVEISVREVGVDLSRRSYVELVDLDIALFEQEAIRVANGSADRSYGLSLAGLDVGWVTDGLALSQAPVTGSPEGSQIRHLVLSDSRLHDIDDLAVRTWAGDGTGWVRPGITDLRIVHNEFARVGFRENEQGGGVGLSFHKADHLLFEGNHVHDIAHNGVQFSQSQTEAGNRGYDLPPEAIYTGDILVRGNLFEDCVENGADAGGLKFWGAVSDRSDVFRDALVAGNVSRNNVGWTWVFEKRDAWGYHGRGGMGYYVDYAGGVSFFRNIAYEDGLAAFMASGSWIDQGAVLANNTFVDDPVGLDMGVRGALSSENAGFQAVNNVFSHLQRFAFAVGEEALVRGEVIVDSNLYHEVGYEPWQGQRPGILAGHVDGSGYRQLPALEDVQALGWEEHGLAGDPLFAGFDPSITDGRWQDLRLTAQSPAVETGAALPASLQALLARFGVDPGQKGAALDRGAIEFDEAHPDAPYVIDVGPTGGSVADAPWSGESPAPDVKPRAAGGGCAQGAGGPGAAAVEWASLAPLWLYVLAVRRRARGAPAGDPGAHRLTPSA
jgi:hypothetical protein